MELIPQTDPLALDTDKPFVIQLLFLGEPLPDTLIKAQLKAEPPIELSAISDSQGRVMFKPPKQAYGYSTPYTWNLASQTIATGESLLGLPDSPAVQKYQVSNFHMNVRIHNFQQPLLLLLIMCWPARAHKHTQAGVEAGWLHPLSGVDHLLAMIAIGAWSCQMGGRAVRSYLAPSSAS